MTSNIVKITRQLAEKLLKLNTNNRPLSQATVKRYAQSMANGDWKENGEAIIVTNLPRLGSGQHRLHAALISGHEFMANLVEGVDDSCFPSLDIGKPRKACDVLSCTGITNASDIAAALSAVSAYKNRTGFAESIGTLRVEDALVKYADHIEEAVSLGSKCGRAVHASRAIFSGAIYWGLKSSPLKTKDFCEKVITGCGLSLSDPAYALRKRLIRDERTTRVNATERTELAGLIAKALIAHISGKKIITLKFTRIGPSAEEFPILEKI